MRGFDDLFDMLRHSNAEEELELEGSPSLQPDAGHGASGILLPMAHPDAKMT